jgi:hypothetical protein
MASGPRVREGGHRRGELDAMNAEILMRLQTSEIAVPSSTRIGGHFVMRVANVNHRSIRTDFELLVEAAERIARDVHHERQ